MTIGTGIVLAAIWLVPVAAFASRTVSGLGVWVALATAILMTFVLR